MASKKVIRLKVDLAELYKRCPTSQLPELRKFHEKRRTYLDKLDKLPQGLPKINWDYYRENVHPDIVPLVEEFKRKYEQLKIPYPEDKYTRKLEVEKEQIKKEIEDFKAASNDRIKKYEDEIKRIQNMPRFEQMTWEDFISYYPEVGPDFINKPTFWPHTHEEQLVDEKHEEIQKPCDK